MISLKILGRRLKRANVALKIQNARLKRVEAAKDCKPSDIDIEAVQSTIKSITEFRDRVLSVIRTRQDPTKAIRCSLPKKKQRELGLLPAIDIITK
jgi:hypothetical protein